jgi:hypothetical protein
MKERNLLLLSSITFLLSAKSFEVSSNDILFMYKTLSYSSNEFPKVQLMTEYVVSQHWLVAMEIQSENPILNRKNYRHLPL